LFVVAEPPAGRTVSVFKTTACIVPPRLNSILDATTAEACARAVAFVGAHTVGSRHWRQPTVIFEE